MTKISPTQRDLLNAAALSPNGSIEAPPQGGRNVSSLIKRGLLMSIPKADAPSQLMITEAGRLAINLPPATPAQAAPTSKGKLGLLIALLQRPGGATIADMMTATGWQAHSVRGAISGALKKDRGAVVSSLKSEGGRVYRITTEAAA